MQWNRTSLGLIAHSEAERLVSPLRAGAACYLWRTNFCALILVDLED